MAKSLLVTRPNDDLATNYLYFWSTLVIKEAEEKRLDVYDLDGKKANKRNFDSYITEHNPEIIFINGHGDENNLTGYDGEVLLKSGDKSEFNENIIYARSCNAASVLGKELTKKGIRAFIGYSRKFNVGYVSSKISKPLEDPIAKLFLEPSNLVVTTLIKGNDVETAHQRSKTAMAKNFRGMLSASATYEEQSAASWLWGNIKSQVYYGNGKAKI